MQDTTAEKAEARFASSQDVPGLVCSYGTDHPFLTQEGNYISVIYIELCTVKWCNSGCEGKDKLFFLLLKIAKLDKTPDNLS